MVDINHRVGSPTKLTSAQVDANFDLLNGAVTSAQNGLTALSGSVTALTGNVSTLTTNVTALQPRVNQLTVIAPPVVTDGVTDNRAVLDAAIASLPDHGGCILLPAGKIVCNNLVIPYTKKSVRFLGASMGGINVGGCGTWLTATSANGSNPIVSMIGPDENTRGYYPQFENIHFFGNGTLAHLLIFRHVSYMRMTRCGIANTSGIGLLLDDQWDSRFLDLEFQFCGGGTATGGDAAKYAKYPATEVYSLGNTGSSNELNWIGCRWEAFPSIALAYTGDNAFCNRHAQCKFETEYSDGPYVYAIGAVDLTITDSVFTSNRPNAAFDSMARFDNCQDVELDITCQVVQASATVARYVKVVGGSGIDVKVKTLLPAPEPTSGFMIGLSGVDPARFNASYIGPLNSPAYDYYYGAQKGIIEKASTALAPASGDTVVVPAYIKTFALVQSSTIAALTLDIRGLPKGSQVTFFSEQAVTSLSFLKDGGMKGGPTTIPAGGFFTLEQVPACNAWCRTG